MKEERIAEIVKKELSERRFVHVLGVVRTAETLALRYGADPEKSRLAAWIHDYAREWPAEKLRSAAQAHAVPAEYFLAVDLLHAPVAAALAPEVFGVNDPAVLQAVRSHTAGRSGMSLLEKIVYIADAIEPGRMYEGVDTVRSLAETDLDRALAVHLDGTIRYLLDHHKPVCVRTVEARNELWQRLSPENPDRREQSPAT
jgi:predicted HD superfamily hydrolase involved in NAD metabolism